MSLWLGVALGVVSSFGANYLYKFAEYSLNNRPLRKIFNFPSGDILFVYAFREEVRDSIMPRTATEDFLAMGSMMRVLQTLGYNKKIKQISCKQISDNDKRNNIVTFCGCRTNTFTEEVVAEYNSEPPRLFYMEVVGRDGIEYEIRHPVDDSKHFSKTYEQDKKYIANPGQKGDFFDREYQDVAIVSKLRNPFNRDKFVFIISGIRGIGTWGAARMFETNAWKQLYKKKGRRGGFSKKGEFSAVISVKFHKGAIIDTKVLDIIDL